MADSPTAAPPTLALPERLTLGEAGPELQRLGRALPGQPGAVVVLDAAPLRDFDSSALAVLLELRRSAQAQGKTLQVEAMPRRLVDLASLYGVRELLDAPLRR